MGCIDYPYEHEMLTNENAQLRAENAALAEQNAKMRTAIDGHLNPCGCFSGCEFCNGKMKLEEALALPDLATPAINRMNVGCIEEIVNLKKQVAELQQIKFKRFHEDECWIYQGNGEDHLESLTCTVVVTVQQINQIKAEGMREAANICKRRVQRVSNGQGISYQSFDPASVMADSLGDAIRAKADELEGKK